LNARPGKLYCFELFLAHPCMPSPRQSGPLGVKTEPR